MDKGNEKRGLVQLVCVLLAFCLWLYVTSIENPNKSSDIKGIPVEIINSDILKDSNLALSPKQNLTVDLRIEGPANKVYSAKVSDFKVVADLESYVLKKGENNVPIKVVNFPEDINIKNTGILSVKVKIEDYAEKYVDIKSKVNILFEEGFSQGSVTINPKNAKVSGAKSAVDNVENIVLMGDANNISSDFEREFEVYPIDKSGNIIKDVNVDIDKGTLNMKIKKEFEIPIKVQYTGKLKDGLSIEKVTLSKNTVAIHGDPKKIEDIKNIETEPINLSDITSDKNISIKLAVPEGFTINDEDRYVNINLKIKNEIPITKSFDVKVNYLGTDNKYEYTNNSVAITVSGIKEVIDSITLDNIKVEASVEGLAVGEHEVQWTASLVGMDGKDVSISSTSGKITVSITALN